MKLIVLGKTGFVGNAIFTYFKRLGSPELNGFCSKDIDLTSPNAPNDLAKALDKNTTLIISARASKDPDPLKIFEQDIAITNNIARAINISPVKKCIYLSSTAVYGDACDNIDITEKTKIFPTSFYGISRQVGEFTIKVVAQKLQIPLTILRPCMIYGPGDRSLPYGPDRFLKNVIDKAPVKLFGKGTDKRDYLYIQDLVDITARFIFNDFPGTYLLGSGCSRSFMDIVECIKNITGRNIKIDQLPHKQPKVDQKLNVQKLFTAFPDMSLTSFEVGMRETFGNIKN
jgi:UDP-glucose 4-epimerase